MCEYRVDTPPTDEHMGKYSDETHIHDVHTCKHTHTHKHALPYADTRSGFLTRRYRNIHTELSTRD